ncbi:HIT domain-containing protein [Patescibacteria group bacterium]
MPECIFCEIIAKKSPAEFVYEGDKVVAFRNINPATPTHVLIVPKRHVSTVTELEQQDKDAAAEMLFAVDQIAEQEGVKDTGFKLVINKGGPHVEMLVNHLHMHLVGGQELKGEL